MQETCKCRKGFVLLGIIKYNLSMKNVKIKNAVANTSDHFVCGKGEILNIIIPDGIQIDSPELCDCNKKKIK